MNSIVVRIMVHEMWDEIVLEVAPTAVIADLKARALAAARVDQDPADYLVKFRGAELDEDGATLATAGVVNNAALIVLRRRRVAVR